MTDQQANFLELPTSFEGSLLLEKATPNWANKYWQNQHLYGALFQNLIHSPYRLVDGTINITSSKIQLQNLRVFDYKTTSITTLNANINYPASGQSLVVFNPLNEQENLSTINLPSSFENLNFEGLALLHCGAYQHTATQTQTFAKVVAPKLHIPQPIGTIMAFDGKNWRDNQTLPGFYACVAANTGHGCPNLEDTFIKGGTTSGVKGGANSFNLTIEQLPAHPHSINFQLAAAELSVSGGRHKHKVVMAKTKNPSSVFARYSDIISGGDKIVHSSNLVNLDTDAPVKSSGTLSMEGTHQTPAYSGNSGNTGGGEAINNQPLFYQTILAKRVKSHDITIN